MYALMRNAKLYMEAHGGPAGWLHKLKHNRCQSNVNRQRAEHFVTFCVWMPHAVVYYADYEANSIVGQNGVAMLMICEHVEYARDELRGYDAKDGAPPPKCNLSVGVGPWQDSVMRKWIRQSIYSNDLGGDGRATQ